jgi:hypothetical protein
MRLVVTVGCLLLAALRLGAAPVPDAPVDFAHLPFPDGEVLTYAVSWGGLSAAEGSFRAAKTDGHWEFKLDLASRGLVNDFYPFTANFWCELAPDRWRSDEYGEFRFEPKRLVKEQTRIDYDAHKGTRAIWAEGKTKTFPIAEEAVDDVGTMLYHLRAGAWKPGDIRILHVYESDSEKEAIAQCEARETMQFGKWPAQSTLRLLVLPGKGTHHRGKLVLWMTDDARHLPLHADLEFRYGTFSIDLTRITPAP